jgi:hypothetical protein
MQKVFWLSVCTSSQRVPLHKSSALLCRINLCYKFSWQEETPVPQPVYRKYKVQENNAPGPVSGCNSELGRLGECRLAFLQAVDSPSELCGPSI